MALVVKNLPANAGDLRHVGSIPGWIRSLGRGHGNPLQFYCLENPMDRGAWRLQSLGLQRVGQDWSDFSSVQLLSRVWLFATPWTTARQASLSITNSRSLPKIMSIELVMPSNHLILCRPLLLPLIFPSIRVFSSESALPIRWPEY